ncbi:hypothetical protein MKW98_020748 [Papaver atlanticum]|uniref:Uncharacterized protein n=1 Tax=Papaver atlanticum TaxID=357466 RepID=A0AAD4TIN8_9MAGN|nr:hypothetical protein MKW98_020748 [Papaver atlanticum]
MSFSRGQSLRQLWSECRVFSGLSRSCLRGKKPSDIAKTKQRSRYPDNKDLPHIFVHNPASKDTIKPTGSLSNNQTPKLMQIYLDICHFQDSITATVGLLSFLICLPLMRT